MMEEKESWPPRRMSRVWGIRRSASSERKIIPVAVRRLRETRRSLERALDELCAPGSSLARAMVTDTNEPHTMGRYVDQCSHT